MPHTILLIQPTRANETRTYTDYETVQECLEGICKIYEEHLRQMHPHNPSITYDISELFKFVDTLFDLSCLVHQASSNMYIPHNKEWLKEKIFAMLKKQANSRS